MEVRRTVSPEQAPTMSSTTFPAHLPNGTTASSCSSVHDSLQGPARHVSPSSGDAGALECSKSISSSNAVHDECLSGTNEGASALSERNASKTASCVEPSGGSSCEAGRALTAKRLTATQDVAVFSEFLEWLQNGQRGRFTEELMVVGFIVLVHYWFRFLQHNVNHARAFLQKHSSVFLPQRQIEIEDMKVLNSVSHIKLSRHLLIWLQRRVDVTVSRLGYRILIHFLSEPEHASLLHVVIKRVAFHITSETVLKEQENHDCARSYLEPVCVSSPMRQERAHQPLFLTSEESAITCSSSVTIPWGLLSGPFNKVERLEPTEQNVPWYFDSTASKRASMLAVINGEITKPVDPNSALPFTDESPWAIESWLQWNTYRANHVITPKSADHFPSILSYHLHDAATAELTTAKLSAWSSAQWLLAARESGIIAAWDIPGLLQSKQKASSPRAMDCLSSVEEEKQHNEDFGFLDPPSVFTDGTQRDTQAAKTTSLPLESYASTPQLLIGHDRSVTALCFVPLATPCLDDNHTSSRQAREKHCLSAAANGVIRLWSLEKATALARYEAHQAPLWSLDVSPYGNFFVSGGSDTLASLWSFTRQRPLRLYSGHLRDVGVVKCSPNSILLATGSSDATLKLWDIRTAKAFCTLPSHQGAAVAHLAFSPNGRLLASSTDGLDQNRRVTVWDIAIQKPLLTVDLPLGVGHLTSLAFSYGSHTLAMGCSNGALLLLNIVDPLMSGDPQAWLNEKKSKQSHSFIDADSAVLRVVPLGAWFPADVVFTPENVLAVCSVPMANTPWTPIN